MTYSKIHQRFSQRLEEPEVLTNPEKYLGPNWEDVLNFWIYVEGLSEQERKEMNQRYCDLDGQDSVYGAAYAAAEEVVGWRFRNVSYLAAADVTGGFWVFVDATWELICHHKLIEQNKTPLALPCCVKP